MKFLNILMKTPRTPANLEELVNVFLESRSRINGLHNGKLGHGLINGEVVDTARGVMGNIHINPSSMGHAASSRINTRGGLPLLDPTRRPGKKNWGVESMTRGKASPRKLYGAGPDDAERYRHDRTYKLVNVLNDDGTPRPGIIDGLTEILKEATKDDAVLYNESEMTDDEIREYISVVFLQLKEWFLEAKAEKEKGLDVTEHNTAEDKNTGPSRYRWTDLKKEEDAEAINSFQNRQYEFISGIVDAKDDPGKIAEAIRPAVEFQSKMHNVYKELALQVKGLEDDQFRGGNPMRIFIQDPDAIFVASVGFWRYGGDDITMERFGVGRQVDISKKTIVLMMPRRKDWNQDDAAMAYGEWKTRFNHGMDPDGTDIHRARTWVSNKAGTDIGPNGKPTGFDLKNYWVDVRFTAPKPGMPKDAFDEIIEKYTPKGAQRFGSNSVSESPSRELDAGENETVPEENAPVATGKTLMKSVLNVAKKFGVRMGRVKDNLYGRAKSFFVSIVERIVDKVLHGGRPKSNLDEVENLVTTSSILFNTRNDDTAKVYLAKAKDAARFARESGATELELRKMTMRAYKATAAITSELIADVVASNAPNLKDSDSDVGRDELAAGTLSDDDLRENAECAEIVNRTGMKKLNESRVVGIENRIRSPKDIARMLGIYGFINRGMKMARNRQFMDADQVENEEMMNRLGDGEDF